MAELVRSHVVHASLQNVTIIHDVVQDVLIRSRLVHGFFHPGEERSDSVQVEQEQNWIVRGDLEFSEDSRFLILNTLTHRPTHPPWPDNAAESFDLTLFQ